MPLIDSLAAMLPGPVQVVVADDVPIGFGLMPDETTSTADMSETRYREFLLGRYCAKKALAALHSPHGPIQFFDGGLISEQRIVHEKIW